MIVADTFMYLYHPYYNCDNDYGTGIFSKENFNELANLLAGIKGKFLLSINDKPQIRSIFAAFNIEGVQTSYTIGNGHKTVLELLI